MSEPLVLHLSDDVLDVLRREAEAMGDTPESVASEALRQRFGRGAPEGPREKARDDTLWSLFGSLPGPIPGGIDNEGIDADLAREYADHHEEP